MQAFLHDLSDLMLLQLEILFVLESFEQCVAVWNLLCLFQFLMPHFLHLLSCLLFFVTSLNHLSKVTWIDSHTADEVADQRCLHVVLHGDDSEGRHLH